MTKKLLILILILGFSGFTLHKMLNPSASLKDKFAPICQGLKERLTTELQVRLDDELSWVEKTGKFSSRSTKLVDMHLQSYKKGDIYFCFYRLQTDNEKIIGNLDIGFQQLNDRRVPDDCSESNICFANQGANYRLLLAIIGGEYRESQHRWFAPAK